MRKFLSILGVVLLILIVVIGAGMGLAVYKGRAFDAASRAFVDRAIPAITAHWDKEELLKRAAPELKQKLKPGEITALFARLSRLGPLVKYEGAKGQANMWYRIGSGASVTAFYDAMARYQNSDAQIGVLLVKRGGRWLIEGFHVQLPPGASRGASQGASQGASPNEAK